MPRSPTILTPPPGILPFVPNTTIRSQDANALFNDLYQDGNTPRPIAYGGTGANNASDALNNLGGVGQSNFLSAFSIGDGYYSARDISSDGGVWLRRNGGVYNNSDYPELSALLPDLPDGVEWNSLSALTGNIQSIIRTPDGYLAASNSSGSSNIYTSTDGASWGLVAVLSSFSIEEVVYQGGIYLAVDGNGLGSVSNDGVTWGSTFTIFPSGGLSSCTFGAGTYVAVGTGGQLSTSTDGTTWTPRTSGVSGLLLFVRYENFLFIAGGLGGSLITSTDGITWSVRTSGVSQSLRDATFGSSLFVVVGAGGTIITSTNGSSWTPRSSGTASTLNAIQHSDSGFIAVGDSGVARISGDAISWTSTPTGVSSSLNTVTYSLSQQNIYYVGGSSGVLLEGVRTLSTQFRVPNDAPQYGWIKADND